MNNIISMTRRGHCVYAPLTLFVDLQIEYISSGRAFHLSELDECLSNCKKILTKIRARKWPIAHFRQLMPSPFFNKQTDFSQWIDEFRPRPNEMVFERSKPSCYSSPDFVQFLKNITTPELIIAGIPGEQSCLATVIESAHKGHLATFVADASASHKIGEWGEAESHEAISKIIALYADICTTEELIDRLYPQQPAIRNLV